MGDARAGADAHADAEHPAARRRFSQNFLVDGGIIDRLVRTIDPRPEHAVLEIGPGRGALTAPLLQRAGHLRAVEIDRDLAALLRGRFPALDLLEGDILRVDPGVSALAPHWRVVGNLPYNISSPVLFRTLDWIERVSDMHFMLQEEFVERMCATPGSKAWGRLSVMLQYRFVVTPLFGVAPECFRPQPKVRSRIVRLQPRAPELPAADPARFARVVSAAFAQRRKTLRNSLRALVDGATLAAIGYDPELRPERLGVTDFVRISNAQVREDEA